MADSAKSGAGATQNENSNTPDSTAGMPYYDKTRQHLKQLLERKRNLERFLSLHEDSIYRKETEYLEDTPQGNIITGFDGYTKGAGPGGVGGRGGAAGAGRKGGLGLGEPQRVFSGSSHTWNSNTDSPAPSASSTPIAAQAPTPLSTSFPKGESASNHPTPTSTTSGGAGIGKGGSKKNKKAAVAAGDDSETDSNPKEAKKARTNFGAVRK
ncbi:chromatin modification-related protein eaf6 [Clarireedia jacksonii]